MAGNSVGTAYLTLVPKLDKGGLSGVESSVGNAGKSGGASFVSNFGSALKGVAGAAVVAEAGKIAAEVFMGAFNNAAENEQLIGGVETLFKDSSAQLIAYAKQGYATAGLSANQYMEQATSFSASLIQSLDNDYTKAADYANMAMVDMSDNANKMGSSMESISNAYQGFAKQNYTMLDNLSIAGGMAA